MFLLILVFIFVSWVLMLLFDVWIFCFVYKLIIRIVVLISMVKILGMKWCFKVFWYDREW